MGVEPRKGAGVRKHQSTPKNLLGRTYTCFCSTTLTAYAKNERADLSASDRADLKKLAAMIVEQYKGKRRKP